MNSIDQIKSDYAAAKAAWKAAWTALDATPDSASDAELAPLREALAQATAKRDAIGKALTAAENAARTPEQAARANEQELAQAQCFAALRASERKGPVLTREQIEEAEERHNAARGIYG